MPKRGSGTRRASGSSQPESAAEALPCPDGLRATPLGPGVVVLDFPQTRPSISAELSDAEAAIARMLYDGVAMADIADARGVSRRTVEKQVSSLYEKLGVTSRAELILRLRGARSGARPGE